MEKRVKYRNFILSKHNVFTSAGFGYLLQRKYRNKKSGDILSLSPFDKPQKIPRKMYGDKRHKLQERKEKCFPGSIIDKIFKQQQQQQQHLVWFLNVLFTESRFSCIWENEFIVNTYTIN
ncbi:hypothetical protein BLOT_010054 [Blomia tropicalis]|nr:hypothetical protein BLOT_010054 [Blomia tropicalis]